MLTRITRLVARCTAPIQSTMSSIRAMATTSSSSSLTPEGYRDFVRAVPSIRLNELRPNPGSRQPRQRVGRGVASGLGKTCGRGHKGTGQRAGPGMHAGFEGGQFPLYRRVQKFGFKNKYGDVDRSLNQLLELALVIHENKHEEDDEEEEWWLIWFDTHQSCCCDVM
jgi:hypothetical protein